MNKPAMAEDVFAGIRISNRDAKALGDTMRAIHRERGHQSTEELYTEIIERSRPEDSPTHHLYEWDLAKGHELYLLERTRQLVMRVGVIFAETPDAPPIRAFRIVTTGGKKGPAPMREIIRTPNLMKALLEEAKADLRRWALRYKQLEQAAGLKLVFKAIRRIK